MLLRVTIFNTSFIHGLPQVVTYIISNLSIDIAMVTMVVGPIQIHPNEDIEALTHLFPPLCFRN